MSIFNGKTILVTGGTGSFGQCFIKRLLSKHNPKAIRIFSRGEEKQVMMQQHFSDDRLRFFIGDIRERDRLHRAMSDVDIVVHACALKHVPVCEYNPIEAVRTNIIGAVNVIDAAIDNNVDRVMAISTDKAVHPTNLYGATKMAAEKLFVQANSYAGGKNTHFSCVRYGNVVCSSGSIIPLFLKQKECGVLTITHQDMTRFWITLDEGSDFVGSCIGRMAGGEIFIPKIASMRIMDLANLICPDAEKSIIGIRPGEKIHEILITEDESRHTLEFKDYFVIEPEFDFRGCCKIEGGMSLPSGFRYASDTNRAWWDMDKLLRIIREYEK